MTARMDHYTFPDGSIPAAYGPYSHAVVAGDYVFLAGQSGRDAQTGRVIEGDVTAQTQRCLDIVREILAQLGLSLNNVVRTTVYLEDLNDFAAMNDVFSTTFQQPYPARSTVQVKLPHGARVAVEATAYRPHDHEQADRQ
jgi:2-iminobutanoate/2-iminopropanoate deaminase